MTSVNFDGFHIEMTREVQKAAAALGLGSSTRGGHDPGIDLIEKPPWRETLATRIREILDHRARAEARPRCA